MSRLAALTTILIIIFCYNVFAEGKTYKPELMLPIGHSDAITSVQFSPDDKFILTASCDKTAKLWETSTGKLIRTYGGNIDFINIAIFSSDGTKIITSRGGRTPNSLFTQTSFPRTNEDSLIDKTAKVWDTESGKLILILKGHTDYINNIDISPNNKYILTSSADSTAKLWDVNDGRNLFTFKSPFGEVMSAVFSPNGEYILTATGRYPYLLGPKPKLITINFSEEDYIPNRTAMLWETSSGKLRNTFKGNFGYVTKRTFSPDSKYIISANNDSTVTIFETLKPKVNFNLADKNISSAEFSPDGKYILTASYDGIGRVLESTTGKLISTLRGCYLDQVEVNIYLLFGLISI
ncbi:WD40 repeat domain-containing protein, partial [Bacteroidota bacterium]